MTSQSKKFQWRLKASYNSLGSYATLIHDELLRAKTGFIVISLIFFVNIVEINLSETYPELAPLAVLHLKNRRDD